MNAAPASVALVPVTVDGWTLYREPANDWIEDLHLATKARLAVPSDIRRTVKSAIEEGALNIVGGPHDVLALEDAGPENRAHGKGRQSKPANVVAGGDDVPLVRMGLVPQTMGEGATRLVNAYLLSRDAAVVVLLRLRTPEARRLQATLVPMLLRVFNLAERGRLAIASAVPSGVPTDYVRALVDERLEHRVAAERDKLVAQLAARVDEHADALRKDQESLAAEVRGTLDTWRPGIRIVREVAEALPDKEFLGALYAYLERHEQWRAERAAAAGPPKPKLTDEDFSGAIDRVTKLEKQMIDLAARVGRLLETARTTAEPSTATVEAPALEAIRRKLNSLQGQINGRMSLHRILEQSLDGLKVRLDHLEEHGVPLAEWHSIRRHLAEELADVRRDLAAVAAGTTESETLLALELIREDGEEYLRDQERWMHDGFGGPPPPAGFDAIGAIHRKIRLLRQLGATVGRTFPQAQERPAPQATGRSAPVPEPASAPRTSGAVPAEPARPASDDEKLFLACELIREGATQRAAARGVGMEIATLTKAIKGLPPKDVPLPPAELRHPLGPSALPRLKRQVLRRVLKDRGYAPQDITNAIDWLGTKLNTAPLDELVQKAMKNLKPS